MKKLLHILAVGVVGATFVSGVACAESTNVTTSSNNGEGSVTANSSSNSTACENNTNVDNATDQSSNSGDSNANGNEGAIGSAGSGDTNTDNNTGIGVNSSCGELQNACDGSKSNSCPVAKPSTKQKACNCKVAAHKSLAPAAPTAASTNSLPETGSATTTKAATVGGAALAGILAIVFAGSTLYKRLALR